MRPKDAEGIANSVDPDQTSSGSTLFAQTYLSENLGWLWYMTKPTKWHVGAAKTQISLDIRPV